MEGDERTVDKSVIYGILAACVLGIIIIGALVLSSDTSEGFSELYFEDHTELPRMIDLGDEVKFAFSVVSHEAAEAAYQYEVTYGDQQIVEGSFTLYPEDWVEKGDYPSKGNEKTIDVNFVPEESSLVQMDDSKISVYELDFDEHLAMVTVQGSSGVEGSNLITSPQAYSVMYWGANNTNSRVDVEMMDKLVIPVDLSVEGITAHTGMLIFDPNLEETFVTNYTQVIRVGDPYSLIPTETNSLSNFGYQIKREEWDIKNNYGDIDLLRRVTERDYRYAFKKVSVEVSSVVSKTDETPTLSEYEIHFWIIVKEDTNKLQDLQNFGGVSPTHQNVKGHS